MSGDAVVTYGKYYYQFVIRNAIIGILFVQIAKRKGVMAKQRIYIQKKGKWFNYSFCENCELRARSLLTIMGIPFRKKNRQISIFYQNKKSLDQLFKNNQIGSEEVAI